MVLSANPDLFTTLLTQGGPYVVLVAAGGAIVRTLWKDKLQQQTVVPALLERTITALNASKEAIDKNTDAKEESTRVGLQQIAAFERLKEIVDERRGDRR